MATNEDLRDRLARGIYPRAKEMAQWARENGERIGSVASGRCIRKHFGCSKQASDAANLLSREGGVVGLRSPIESAPPVLKAGRRFDPTDMAYRGPTVAKLRLHPMSLPELAEFLGTDAAGAQLMLDSLLSVGYIVEEADGRWRVGTLRPDTQPTRVSLGRLDALMATYGLISDPHVASIYHRPELYEVAYDDFAQSGITDVFLCGNFLDGHWDRINGSEVLFRNASDQAIYAADNWPQRDGITTHFITGDCHEGWWGKGGINVGRYIQGEFESMGRKDVRYIGHMEADIELPSNPGMSKSVMRLFHPGGGSAYAQSYKPQKIVESYQGGEKPHILAIGHYHKAGYFYPRGVHCILVPCGQDQSRFMRKRQIEAHVGYLKLTVGRDEQGGVIACDPQFRFFYDKGYHVEHDVWFPAISDMLGRAA